MYISKIDSHNHKNEYPEIRKFSDNELFQISSVEPDRRFKKVSKNVVNTLLFAIPAVDIAANAIVKRGSLSSKLKQGGITAGIWAIAFASGAAVQSVKKFVNSHSEFFNDFNNKHPFLSTLADFAAIFAAFTTALNGIQYLKTGTKKLFPNAVLKFNENISKPLKNILDNSILNKKLLKSAGNFFAQKPNLAKATKISALLLVPAMFTGVLVRYLAEAKKRDENIVKNYAFLKYINDFIPDEQQTIE